MASARERKKQQKKKQLSQLNETSNDVIIGNRANVSVVETETLEQQTDGQHYGFERLVDSASQNHAVENNEDKIERAVDNLVFPVQNRMHDAILTAMDKVVLPGVEMAVRSFTGSSGHGPNNGVQNPDRRDFLGNANNTPLMSASNRLNLIANQDRNDENNKYTCG